MIKLIASDLDGTIVDYNHHISKENLKAIDDLQTSSCDFVICTGKTYALSRDFCKNFHASYGIFGNGSQIINLQTGEEIAKKILSLEEIKTCLSIAKKYHLHVHAYTENSILTEKLLYMDLRNSILFPNQIKIQLVKNLSTYLTKEKTPILKLVISSPSSLKRGKQELEQTVHLTIVSIQKYGNYKDTVINKEYEYLDISPLAVSKGAALQTLGNYLHLNKEEILSIGDNLNDIDMLQSSGIGVAVQNAYSKLKEVATYTTTRSVEEGGFAEAVYRFIPFPEESLK